MVRHNPRLAGAATKPPLLLTLDVSYLLLPVVVSFVVLDVERDENEPGAQHQPEEQDRHDEVLILPA